MDQYLLGQISEVYWQMDQLPWLEKLDKGWHYQYTGQMRDLRTGNALDQFFFSFSDSTSKYDMEVEIAMKCYSKGASCFTFPRQFQQQIQDKTVVYGLDPESYTFLTTTC